MHAQNQADALSTPGRALLPPSPAPSSPATPTPLPSTASDWNQRWVKSGQLQTARDKMAQIPVSSAWVRCPVGEGRPETPPPQTPSAAVSCPGMIPGGGVRHSLYSHSVNPHLPTTSLLPPPTPALPSPFPHRIVITTQYTTILYDTILILRKEVHLSAFDK